MSAQPAESLPVIFPTVPGKVAGIVNMTPVTVQCQECGALATCETVGLPSKIGKAGEAACVLILSGFHFHSYPWSDGRTDNPRLCRPCRMARQCQCHRCREERRGA